MLGEMQPGTVQAQEMLHETLADLPETLVCTKGLGRLRGTWLMVPEKQRGTSSTVQESALLSVAPDLSPLSLFVLSLLVEVKAL